MPVYLAKGIVWTSIVEHVDDVGWDNTWVTVANLDRSLLSTHPWSLTGGSAIALRAHLDARSGSNLGEIATDIGFMAVTREDDAYISGGPAMRRQGTIT